MTEKSRIIIGHYFELIGVTDPAIVIGHQIEEKLQRFRMIVTN